MALNQNVKPQKLAAVAANVVEQKLVVPSLFQREGFDQFKGAENDTVYIRVEGVLPAHDIEDFRAERTSDITLDAYAERKIQLTLSGNTYQATKLQDEQKDWDLIEWSRVVKTQATAVARKLERKAITQLTSAPYLATIGGAVSRTTAPDITKLRAGLIKLRGVANRFQMPTDGRTLVVGTDVEEAILSDKTLVLADAVGADIASAAVREALIGRLMGFNILVSQELAKDKAYLISPGAFVMATAAPSVPQSIKFGATASARTIAMRWLMDYEALRFNERSVVNTYNGVRYVTDVMLNADETDVIRVGSTVGEFFIRGVAFDFDATSDVLPDADVNADADGVGGTPAAGSLLDQFVAATTVGTKFTA